MKIRDFRLSAIETVQRSVCAYTKFITANDTNATRSNQSGYYLHKDAWRLFFDSPFKKGENKDKFVDILWQGEFKTRSRAIYYGVAKNEYRLTRFGHGFPYRTEENIGNLLILCQMTDVEYQAFVLESDEDIDDFFAAFNISPADVNGIIEMEVKPLPPEDALTGCFDAYLSSLQVDFPDTEILARQARDCYRTSYRITDRLVIEDPDSELLKWLKAEYRLFRLIENDRYSQRISVPFTSVEELVETANTLLNRRKSRAGKSLEHHLAEMFRLYGLDFEAQGVTEGTKRPDFIFPGSEAYRDLAFDEHRLIILAAKTTCKDRWRQVTKEADRVTTKYLFTLQEGISKNQLQEMSDYQVCLVVPKEHLNSFPQEFRSKILTLSQFIKLVQGLRVSAK